MKWTTYRNPVDHGPIYAETRNLSQTIVEPYNAYSSLFFLIPAIYWLWKLKSNYRKNAFLVYCATLLIIGGLGSTFFHAFRIHYVFLLMDFVPIAVLTLSVSIYFWNIWLKNYWITGIIILTSFVIRYLIIKNIPHQYTINVSYIITGFLIFIPIIHHLFINRFRNIKIASLACILFIIAIIFRQIDRFTADFLPMGTHFLWHIFCALGAWFLADYIYLSIKPKN